MHELVRWNAQFDWAHKFYHTNNWFAIAARHFFDELTLGQNAIEFHIATNVILETGFTNLQFVGLASLAHEAGDYLFEKMVTSIQTDEARHAQIGHPVLALVMKHDPDYAQYLVDKWFWRNRCDRRYSNQPPTHPDLDKQVVPGRATRGGRLLFAF
jgi:toluene monooxygenase system protein A